MPCCLLLILAFFGPRVAMVLLALFSDFFERPFDGLLMPILGWIFLPLTTLAYAWSINQYGEVTGLGLLLVIVGALFDIGAIGGGATRRRFEG